MSEPYLAEAPTRADVDAWVGPAVIEFGTGWCGHCRAARPSIDAAIGELSGLRHLKVEDGPGRALGRSFGVRIWPTLVVLKDGSEVGRIVRPRDVEAVRRALDPLRARAG